VNRLLLVVLVGCTYYPDSYRDFRGSFPGTRQTVGCLDIAVDKGSDALAEGPVLSYGFGNRCRHPVTIDLATLHVRGRTEDGVDRDLIAFDPQHELRPEPLDAMFAGRENIEYVSTQPIVQVCVDIGSIDGSREHDERWVCK
jgi:hypothetical protein